MKNFIDFIKYSIITVFVVLIFFPFLHELGHALSALIMGGTIVSFSLFPLPHVVCMADPMSLDLCIIGLSGIVSPYLFLIVLNIKKARTEIKFSLFLLEIVSIFSLGINIVLSILTMLGQNFAGDDIDIVLSNTTLPQFGLILFFVALLILICLLSWKRKHYLVFQEM